MQRRIKKRNREHEQSTEERTGVKVGVFSFCFKSETERKNTEKESDTQNSPSARKLQDRVEQEMYIQRELNRG